MAKIMMGKAEPREGGRGNDRQNLAVPALFSNRAQDAFSPPGECVIKTLSSLRDKCLVVHEVAARYGNIEHLVIREDGAVFLIETRLHRGLITQCQGELLVNGGPFETDFIRQTTTNAFVLRDLLADGLGISPFIHAAIVFPNASVSVEKA